MQPTAAKIRLPCVQASIVRLVRNFVRTHQSLGVAASATEYANCIPVVVVSDNGGRCNDWSYLLQSSSPLSDMLLHIRTVMHDDYSRLTVVGSWLPCKKRRHWKDDGVALEHDMGSETDSRSYRRLQSPGKPRLSTKHASPHSRAPLPLHLRCCDGWTRLSVVHLSQVYTPYPQEKL